jgi:hypothetical protein
VAITGRTMNGSNSTATRMAIVARFITLFQTCLADG